MRICDYSIIESDNQAELVEAVCGSLKHGWEPCGGVCVWFEPARITASNEVNFVSTAGAIVHYVQALVRYAP